MAEDTITVQSITGVDLTLQLAGPGSRSYAFIIDWHVRAIIAGIWLFIAAAFLKFHVNWKSAGALFAILPPIAFYFLYHPVVEVAMRGLTPGKRIAGVRILSRSGGQPTVSALLIRNIFRLIDSLPGVYALGLITCIFSKHRVRVGDLAAGTLLVMDNPDGEKTLARVENLARRSTLPLETLELADQILERWDSLESDNRMQIARALLAQVLPPAEAADLSIWSDNRLRAQLKALLYPEAVISG
jgi:uncharacterized RDD family membrane protein YckC